jgi:hypothetical protein
MNNTIEKEKTAAITSYILGIGVFIAMSMNSEDKKYICIISYPSGTGITLTFISLGLIISNFDSMLISAQCGFSFCTLVIWYLQRHKGETKPMPLLGYIIPKMVFKYL